ncbi:MAG: hypothetical protein MUE54_06400, partial [Anaerolineae bacterium]|nr:hypothetical protein [Anaerolineae bacterium]
MTYRYGFVVVLLLLMTTSLLAQNTSPTIERVGEAIVVDANVVDMALMPNGTTLVVADEAKTISFFNVADGGLIGDKITIGNGDLFLDNAVHYSANGRYVLVGTFFETLMLNGLFGNVAYRLPVGGTDVAFSPDGNLFYILENDTITAYDTPTGQVINQVMIGATDDGVIASDLEVLADGTLVLLNPDTSYEYYLTTVSPDFTQITTSSIYGRNLVVGGDVIVNVYYANLTAYTDVVGEGISLNATPCADYTDFDVHPTAPLLATVAGNCEVHVFDMTTGTQIYFEAVPDAGQIVFGERVLYVSSANVITRYQVTIPTPEETTSTDTTTAEVTPQPTNKVIYSLNLVNTIGADSSFAGVAVSPDGSKVAGISGFGSDIVAYNTSDGSEIGRSTRSAGSSNIAYSADSTKLVAIDADGLLMIFDANSMALLNQVQMTTRYSAELVADANYAYMYGVNDIPGDVLLSRIDLNTAQIQQVTAYENVFVTPGYLQVLPDGTLIGAGSTDNGDLIKTWDSALTELSAEMTSYFFVESAEDVVFHTTFRRDNDVTTHVYNLTTTPNTDPIVL